MLMHFVNDQEVHYKSYNTYKLGNSLQEIQTV